jgi:cytochrome c oxidase cbb3-type subunit 3
MTDGQKSNPKAGSGEVQTTGHEWDGIREFDNPLPAWWRWIFYGCIVWSIGYWIAMPAWPTVSGYTKGLLGYSSRAELDRELIQARSAFSGLRDEIQAASLETIRKNPALMEYALAGGRSAFAVNCAQCHGSGASGGIGYPNLNDDEWLWGGKLEQIAFTIRHGVRNVQDEEARSSQMPAFLKDGILSRQDVNDVTEYVLQLSQKDHDHGAAARGAAIFKDNCASCHGAAGQGSLEFGAPALNNDIWLYGGDRNAIRTTVANARRGVMPAWGKILDDITVKQLTLYVHSLGGGQN